MGLLREKLRSLSLPVAVLLTIGIFFLDLRPPLWKVGWAWYLTPLLLTLWTRIRTPQSFLLASAWFPLRFMRRLLARRRFSRLRGL